MQKKKLITIILLIILVPFVFAGCADKAKQTTQEVVAKTYYTYNGKGVEYKGITWNVTSGDLTISLEVDNRGDFSIGIVWINLSLYGPYGWSMTNNIPAFTSSKKVIEVGKTERVYGSFGGVGSVTSCIVHTVIYSISIFCEIQETDDSKTITWWT